MRIKHGQKINQRACYNRIWSWSPMPCEKHGPRDSVDKNRGRKTWPSGLSNDKNLGLRPRFLSTESLGPCFSHGTGDHDQILHHIPVFTCLFLSWILTYRTVICNLGTNLIITPNCLVGLCGTTTKTLLLVQEYWVRVSMFFYFH